MILNDFTKIDNRKIILVGGGKDCQVIENGLQKRGVKDYYICDKKFQEMDKNGRKLCYSNLKKVADSNFLISSSKYCVEIYKSLKMLEIPEENIFTAKELYKEGFGYFDTDLEMVPLQYTYDVHILQLYAYLEGGWNIRHLDVFITERCTLRCKYCCALIPYYENPIDLCEEDIFEGLDNLLSSGCYIDTLCLMGGEPLLNQSLIRKFLKKYKDCSQIAVFQTITNGTIVPENETIEMLKDISNFYVIFSNYDSLSVNQDKAIEKFRKENIKVALEQNKDIRAEANTLWLDYGEVKKYGKSNEEIQKMYDNCLDGKFCTTLLKNRLYVCNRIAHGINMGMIPNTLYRAFFDLSDNNVKNQTKEEIKNHCNEILFGHAFPEACDYCNRGAGILGKRAEQMKR